jgi:xylitol oxidase
MIAGKNWAGNYTYGAKNLHQPESTEELQEIVSASSSVKALGSRHSFNDIADTQTDLVSMRKLNQVVELDPVQRTVRVQGGITYGELCPVLEAAGFALPNLASLPHISVAGAVATATHGSGELNGNLATSVVGLQMVRADSSLGELTERDPEFAASVVGLGALGLVTELKLRIVPTFRVRQFVYEELPLAAVSEHFDAIQASAYSVSLFTDWRTEFINQAWLKMTDLESTPSESLFGGKPADDHRHPIRGVSAENCTEQMGVSGPWNQRLAHFKLEFTPSNGEELQSEYFVQRSQVGPALAAVASLRDSIAPLLYISEIRTVAQDSLWLSPAYGQDVVGFHFTWQPREAEVRAFLPTLEAALAPFSPRPHWGKLFEANPAGRYPRITDFRALAQRHDPTGKFRNEYLDRTIFA